MVNIFGDRAGRRKRAPAKTILYKPELFARIPSVECTTIAVERLYASDSFSGVLETILESSDSTTAPGEKIETHYIDPSPTDSPESGGEPEHELADFVQMLDRLTKVLRVYPRHHPVAEEVAGRCLTRLDDSLEDAPLTIELGTSEVRGPSGDVLHTPADTESEEFIWYQPHEAGLRELTFAPETDSADLRRLMRVVANSSERGSGNDDIITRLWDLQLDTIEYGLSLADVQGGPVQEFDDRTPGKMVEVLTDAATGDAQARQTLDSTIEQSGVELLSPVCRQQLDEARQSGIDVGTRKALSFPVSVADERREALLEEWHDDGELESRFLQSLLSILDERPETEAAGEVADRIVEMALKMLQRGRYATAHRLVEAVRRQRKAFDGEANPLETIRERASDPQVVEGLLWRLQKSEQPDEDLFELMKLFDRKVAQRQALSILAGDDEPRDVTLLYELLVELARQAVSAPGYDDELVGDDRLVERLLPLIAEGSGDSDPLADAVVRSALETDDSETIVRILQTDLPQWDDPRWVGDRLTGLIDHSDEQVRRRIYERLSDHPELFEKQVRKMIDDESFGSRDAGELQFLFRRFADETGDLELLRQCLTKSRGWLAGANQEATRAAARVLLQFDDEQAVEQLRDRANSILTAPDLKQALKERLEFHGYEPE